MNTFIANTTYALRPDVFVSLNDEYEDRCNQASFMHTFVPDEAQKQNIPLPENIVPLAGMAFVRQFGVAYENMPVPEDFNTSHIKDMTFTVTSLDKDGDPCITCRNPNTNELEECCFIHQSFFEMFEPVTVQ